MEWLPYVHDALNYIEENLLNVENPKEVADHLNMSEPYLQKGFQILTGYPIGEYIRNRRLYEAAVEISESDIKIVDAAMKYGYDSQEGFVKAFVRFHGINPSVMRKDGYTGYKKFLPITIDLLVKGGGKTDVKVVKKFGFKVVGFEKEIPEENAIEAIQDFWDEVYATYFIDNDEEDPKRLNHSSGGQKIADGNNERKIAECRKAVAENGVGEYGIVLRKTTNGFLYMIAGRCAGGVVPEGMSLEEIPASEWAIFDNIGPMTEGMMSIEAEDAKEWINSTTDYEANKCLNIEWYESIDRNKHHEEYRSALWIPVTCKAKTDENEKSSGPRKFYKWKRFAVSFACIALLVGVSFLITNAIKNYNPNKSNDFSADSSTAVSNSNGNSNASRPEPLGEKEKIKLAEKIRKQLPEDVWGGYYTVPKSEVVSEETDMPGIKNTYTKAWCELYIYILKDYDELPRYDEVFYQRVNYSTEDLFSIFALLKRNKEKIGFYDVTISYPDCKVVVKIDADKPINEEALYELVSEDAVKLEVQ